MNHIKSYGTCTRNEQGMFEIQWEVESNWFKRLFKIKTEFKYMCDYARYLNQLDVQWVDQEGAKLTDVKTLHELRFILQYESYVNQQGIK